MRNVNLNQMTYKIDIEKSFILTMRNVNYIYDKYDLSHVIVLY